MGSITAFLLNLGYGNYLFAIALFLIVIFAMKKSIKLLLYALYISIGAALFPFVMNMFGWEIPLTSENILAFVTIGLGLLFIYMLISGIYHILRLGEKALSRGGKKSSNFFKRFNRDKK